MNGSEPPSSSTLFFSARPAAAATAAPARSLPVRVTAAIARVVDEPRADVRDLGVGDQQRAEHALGQPGLARRASSIASAQPGTFEACLSSAALPAISAGAAKRKTCQNGKFHGMIASTTPSGS